MKSDDVRLLDPIDIVLGCRDIAPQTKEALDSYLRFYYEVFLASTPIDDGNSSPLDFAWHIYSVAMGLKKDVNLCDYNILGMAARGSMKSLTCAIIEILLLCFDKDRDYFHMASIYDQSKVTYGYVQGILNKRIMRGAVKSFNSRETISNYDRKLKIGTGTIRSVNAFHGSVIQDEVDLTNRQVFIESKGMLSAGKNGKSPLDIKISSRKFAHGNIQTLLDNVKKDKKYPISIHRWGQLEVTEKCLTERSLGEDKSDKIYINEELLSALSADDYDKILDPKIKSGYAEIFGYPGCLPCGIFSFCKGNLKKQTVDNPYLTPIDDVKRWFLTDDLEFFKSQRLNRKPSSSGLIFYAWDPFVHQSSTYEEMYSLFFKKQYEENKELTLKDLITKMLALGCKAYLGIDFGFNVAVALLILVDGSGKHYILDQVVSERQSDADFAKMSWDRWKWIPIIRGFGDIASPGGIMEFAKYFPMLEPVISEKKDSEYRYYTVLSKNYDYRFGQIRKLLRAPDNKTSGIYVMASVSEIVDYMGIYRYHVNATTGEQSEYPADGQRDHGIDALGHGIVGIQLAGGGSVKMITANIKNVGDQKIIDMSNSQDVSSLLNEISLGDNGEKMPARSVPIDPITGMPLSTEELHEDEALRPAKKFTSFFV